MNRNARRILAANAEALSVLMAASCLGYSKAGALGRIKDAGARDSIGLGLIELAEVGGLERFGIRAANNDVDEAVHRQADFGADLRLRGVAEIAVLLVAHG